MFECLYVNIYEKIYLLTQKANQSLTLDLFYFGGLVKRPFNTKNMPEIKYRKGQINVNTMGLYMKVCINDF